MVKGRPVVGLLCGVAFFLLARQSAQAVTEFCPGAVTQVAPIGVASNVAATRYTYRIAALSPRRLDAGLIAVTDRGWFMWSLHDLALEPDTAHVRIHHIGAVNGHAAVDDIAYEDQESPTLSIRFPTPVTVQAMWVSDAQTSGETVFGWDAKGRVQCDAPVPSDLMGEDRRSLPPDTTTVAVAPDVSADAVAVNADGTIADHWIIGTSMPRELANAFEMNVATAHFMPAVSFCHPVPAIFWYHAQQQVVRRGR
jgi:hypothetical protein